jgi:hypothetical protein
VLAQASRHWCGHGNAGAATALPVRSLADVVAVGPRSLVVLRGSSTP